MRSLQAKLIALMAGAVALAALVHAALTVWPLPQMLATARLEWQWTTQPPEPFGLMAGVWTFLIVLPLYALAAEWMVQPLQRLLRALQGAVLSYREGDFSISLNTEREDELGQLLRLHAELGRALREQRQQLAQRELLLDTVVQHTPLALLLFSEAGRVVYANIAARRLLADGRSLVGQPFDAVLVQAPTGLAQALAQPQDQLVSLGGDERSPGVEHYHLSQRPLQLLGTPHRLILLRHMTRELAREEVATWKRVIRVISHELNNSLAPISSMAHSGAELARRGQADRLPQVFDAIGERAAHLHAFLASYAHFAKLPAPVPQAVEWRPFLSALAEHSRYALIGAPPPQPGRFDATQVEQALINLIRNAHESGSAADAVSVRIVQRGGETRIEVADRGPGMSEAVLAQALLPFYSTKRSGTGLGLALAREIAEAHGGRVLLANREGGGLMATLVLPG